jgi:Fe-S-cluster-containing hydrogenase component 2
VIACPFGTIFFDPPSGVAAKCDLCAGDPACAKACPTGAIEAASGDTNAWIGDFGARVDQAYRRASRGGAR